MNYHITKSGSTYTATRDDEKDFISSPSLSALVDRLESKSPKPEITFDDESRVDFYRSL